MALNLIIPEINNKPGSTKDAVISILTIEWPLSLRNIFYKIKKQYGYSSTYQSVYKAVKELCELGVLKEKDKRYEIDIEWIKRVQSFTDIVETNYYAKERVQNLSGVSESKAGEDLIILNFDTIFDAEKYLYYFMKTELFKKKGDNICFQLSNEWRPIFYLRAEYNYYRRLKEKGHEFYFLCSGDSYLEEVSKKFYKSLDIHYKTVKSSSPSDTIVFGNYFIQIFIPENLRIKMKNYLENKDILKLLEEVLQKKAHIKIVINKDPALSEEIKKQIIRKF
ncbi:Uncharacterised protein [uncultured archaeon]|nr:Uncharacterised protein [uncultured archaeon]